MKMTDWIIIFVIITIPFNLMDGYKAQRMQVAMEKSIAMNKILDRAVEDGTRQLVPVKAGMSGTIDYEKAVETFFETLFISQGITEDALAQEEMKNYIPAILVIDRDGYYVWGHHDYLDGDGYHYLDAGFSEKRRYGYTEGRYLYEFSLDEQVVVYDLTTHAVSEGYRADLSAALPDSILSDEERFGRLRRHSIMRTLTQALEYNVNNHNRYAKAAGVTYRFYLPETDESVFANSIEDVGMVVLFQGMPLGFGDATYNRFAFGGAGLVKSGLLYTETAANGLVYYHRETCTDLHFKSTAFPSPRECAMAGAFPCDRCRP